MVPKQFAYGDLVWAKMKGYPFWPGKVVKPRADQKNPSKPKKNQHYVFFFGSENHAWIPDENITHHSDEVLTANSTKKKSREFQSAVDIISEISKMKSKKVKLPADHNEKPKHSEKKNSSSQLKSSSGASNENEKGHSSSSDPEKLKVTPKKSAVKRSHSELDSDFPEENISNESPPVSEVYNNGVILDISKSITFPKESSPRKKRAPSPNHLDLDISEILNRPDRPSDIKVGFLGLGNMGQEIVKNLIKSGHRVTVWNRTPEKCEEFVGKGANMACTPAEVVSVCDVTFCCVSDPDACKSVVFGNNGVIEGLETGGDGKGYVEMTTIDPQTSLAVAEGIIGKGGTYLEAHINGSRKNAEDGTLFILLAGNRELFANCKSCFKAVSKKAYYIGRTVGTGTQMNLILSMLEGVIYAALGEALALTDRLSLSQNDFVEVLELSSLNCVALKEKGKAIVKKDYTTNTALKHVQKDMNMAITMASLCDQSTPLAAAANEMYKHAKLLRYGDKDVCAVYKGSKI